MTDRLPGGLRVRAEIVADAPAIAAVHEAAFPTDAEARLVSDLRRSGALRLSLVAEADGLVLGHIAFSPVQIDAPGAVVAGLGLAPVAVRPEHQGRGIGAALIRRGLALLRAERVPYVVVLGEPAYYGRFGFGPAHARGIGNEYGARDAFMIVELVPDGLPDQPGVARYGEAFARFG